MSDAIYESTIGADLSLFPFPVPQRSHPFASSFNLSKFVPASIANSTIDNSTLEEAPITWFESFRLMSESTTSALLDLMGRRHDESSELTFDSSSTAAFDAVIPILANDSMSVQVGSGGARTVYLQADHQWLQPQPILLPTPLPVRHLLMHIAQMFPNRQRCRYPSICIDIF
jgi:hypothetical protein